MKISGIACEVELSSGAKAGFWISGGGRIDLAGNYAVLGMNGYVSKAAYEAGKPVVACTEKQINNISSLPNFNAMWADVVGVLLAQHYPNGTIEQAEKPASNILPTV
jgi:hypothetical protein